MVNHRVHDFVIPQLEVRGHNAVRHYNENTRHYWMSCDTRNWFGPSYGPRHRKDVTDTWREHAADVVMGADLSHGRADYACRCYRCERVRREAKGGESA